MKIKKYLVALIALSLLFAIPTVAIAQDEYSDVVTDPEGDVAHWSEIDPFPKTAERPNVDITRVELSASEDTIIVSLTVVGEILDTSDDFVFVYNIRLLDEDGQLYWIQYTGKDLVLAVGHQTYDEVEKEGVGTNTMTVKFSAEEVGKPDMLEISDAESQKEVVDGEGVTHWYRDLATPDDEEGDPTEEEYSDEITDPEGNVMQATGEGEDDWEFFERPNIDITHVEISESDGIVTLSLTVKGTITDDPDIIYQIYMKDGDGGTYDIEYSDSEGSLTVHGHYFVDVAVDGVGSDTLSIVFAREQIYNPEELLISKVETYNEGFGAVDMAGPDAEYPPGYEEPETGEELPGDDNGDNGDDGNGDDGNGDDGDENGKEETGDDDEEKGFLSGYWWIIPIIVIGSVVGLVLAMKMGNKGKPMQPRPGMHNQQQTYEEPQQDTPPPPPPAKE